MKRMLFFASCALTLNLCAMMNNPPVSLKNCGVSCYMNSTIQALYTVESLTNLLLGVNYPSQYPFTTNPLAYYYTKITHEMYASVPDLLVATQVEVTLEEFYKETAQQLNKGNIEQEDSSECLNNLLLRLSSGQNATTNGAIKILFGIQQKRMFKTTTVPAYEKEEGLPTYYFYAPLPIVTKNNKELTTLEECFKFYTAWEPEEGQVEGQEIRLLFATNPDYFIIVLNKFLFDKRGKITKKLQHNVAIPEIFNLAPYMIEGTKGPINYRLISSIYHQGEAFNAGHYIAWVKRNNGWYLCNDKDITQVSNFNAMKKHSNFPLDKAYVFIYQKEGIAIIPAPKEEKKPALPPKQPTKPITPPIVPPPLQPVNSLGTSLNNVGQAVQQLTNAVRRTK